MDIDYLLQLVTASRDECEAINDTGPAYERLIAYLAAQPGASVAMRDHAELAKVTRELHGALTKIDEIRINYARLGPKPTASCPGCGKCARHPGEGYACLLHPIGKVELDRVAQGLIKAWERREAGVVPVSRMATFVDMARVVIEYARVYDYNIDGVISENGEPPK